MMKKKLTFKGIIMEMITTNIGTISSKIIIGAICYILLTVSLLTLTFVNPGFPGLSDIMSVLIITSGSLLGLTTIENIRNGKIENETMHGGSHRDIPGGETGGEEGL